jgi:hypothetical protein
MKRFLVVCALMSCGVLAGAATFDDGSYLGVRYVKTPDNKVRISSVDRSALGWRMGLRENDIFLTIAGKKVDSIETVKAGLQAIREKDGETFDIAVERLISSELGSADLDKLGKLLITNKDKSGKASKDKSTVVSAAEKNAKNQPPAPRRIRLKGIIRESANRRGFFYATFQGSGERGIMEGAPGKTAGTVRPKMAR